ncbi:MAG: hypothetical protein QNJ31_01005 [Candidatus Caenarcaniphilales bacterium]|nr:hypothetical protein [Candidatus Caenarcaniphilales bacterium]
MKLEVITPNKGKEIDKEVCLLEAEGINGAFGILEGHIPFITLLKDDGVIRFQTNSSNPIQSIKVKEAILETSASESNKKESIVKIISSQIEEI